MKIFIFFLVGFKMVVHTGSAWGYKAMLSWNPGVNLGIFVTFSGNDPNYFYRVTLHNYIFDVYKGIEPYLNSSTICIYPMLWIQVESPKQRPNHSKELIMQHEKEGYVGTYHNIIFGSLEVKGRQDAS